MKLNKSAIIIHIFYYKHNYICIRYILSPIYKYLNYTHLNINYLHYPKKCHYIILITILPNIESIISFYSIKYTTIITPTTRCVYNCNVYYNCRPVYNCIKNDHILNFQITLISFGTRQISHIKPILRNRNEYG